MSNKLVITISLLILVLSTLQAQFAETDKLVPPGRSPNEVFGESIYTYENTAMIGAPQRNVVNNTGSLEVHGGLVYITNKNSTGWGFIQNIQASDVEAFSYFGASIAIDEDVAIIGAPGCSTDENGNNSLNKAGAVYIFKKDGNGSWNEVQKIVGSSRSVNDGFGSSVAIYNDCIIIGAPQKDKFGMDRRGAVYVFEKDGNNQWSETTIIEPNDLPVGAQFGYSIDMVDDQIIIGAPYMEMIDSANTITCGSAFIYNYNNDIWSLHQQITPPTNAENQEFGYVVKLLERRALIGSPGYNQKEGQVVLVLEDLVGSWTSSHVFHANNISNASYFGAALDFTDNHILIGSPLDNVIGSTSSEVGSVILFEKSASSWIPKQVLRAKKPNTQDQFGTQVAFGDQYSYCCTLL